MGTEDRFGQGSFPPSPTPLPGLGGLQTSLTLPATLAAACSPPVASPGGQAVGRRKGGSRCGSPGAPLPEPGKGLWAMGGSQGLGEQQGGQEGRRAGGCAPAISAISPAAWEDAPLLHFTSRAGPALHPACPALCLGPSTFLEKCRCVARGTQAGKEVTRGRLTPP